MGGKREPSGAPSAWREGFVGLACANGSLAVVKPRMPANRRQRGASFRGPWRSSGGLGGGTTSGGCRAPRWALVQRDRRRVGRRPSGTSWSTNAANGLLAQPRGRMNAEAVDPGSYRRSTCGGPVLCVPRAGRVPSQGECHIADGGEYDSAERSNFAAGRPVDLLSTGKAALMAFQTR